MCHKEGKTLEQGAQKGCAVSILGGFQQQSGERPEQPGLTSPLTLH